VLLHNRALHNRSLQHELRLLLDVLLRRLLDVLLLLGVLLLLLYVLLRLLGILLLLLDVLLRLLGVLLLLLGVPPTRVAFFLFPLPFRPFVRSSELLLHTVHVGTYHVRRGREGSYFPAAMRAGRPVIQFNKFILTEACVKCAQQ
jgi:hypothetical protein